MIIHHFISVFFIYFSYHSSFKCSYTLVKLNELPIIAFVNPFLPEFSDPPNPENVRSHSSNLMKLQPHYSQSSRENVTPSRTPSLLACH